MTPSPLRRAFCACAVLLASALPSLAQELEVHVIDVDQGLSVLVIGPTGTSLLVDGGNPGQGSSIVKPYLQSQGLSALHYSVATHWHTDHMGGLDEVFNGGFKPLFAAYDRGNVNIPSNNEVTQYLASVSGVRVIASIGQTIDLGGGAAAQITSLNGQYLTGSVGVSGSSQEENSRSITVVVRFGDFDCYIGGDLTSGGGSTTNVEGPATAAIGQVEMAVAAHHGSTTSSSATVVSNLSPSFVVHSAGQDNPYGHPAKSVVNNWNTLAAARVQWCTTEGDTGNGAGGFTAANGHVVVETDGATFEASRSAGPERVGFDTFEQAGAGFAAGQIAATELLVDPQASSDLYGEWFELASLAGSTLDLGGMRFTSGASTFTVASRILLGAGERFVIGADGRMSRNGQVFTGLGAPWEQFALSNSTSSLALKSAANAAIETVAWGSGGFSVVAGRSAERIDPIAPPSASNFALASSAWAGADQGSPWQINGSEPPTCASPTPYGTGKLSSIGTLPSAIWTGTPGLFVNDFMIHLANGVPGKSGIGFWGSSQASIPFQGGTLLVQPPIARLPVQVLDPFGAISYAIPVDGSMVGATRCYQFWFRDPDHPDGWGIGLSSAIEVVFCTH